MTDHGIGAGTAQARRERILAHLAGHPDRTVHEICVDLGFMRESGRGCTGGVLYLLRTMEKQALVVARTEFRAQQGRQVRLWRTTPPGTAASQRGVSPTAVSRRPEPGRVSKRRGRTRARGVTVSAGLRTTAVPWTLPSGAAACRGADACLFFPEPGESDAQAKAICAVCPVQAECLAAALANGERYGVWGGVNLEAGEHVVSGAS
jgi:transcription factor WhiB